MPRPGGQGSDRTSFEGTSRVWEVRMVNQDNLVVYGHREPSAKAPGIHREVLCYGGSPEVTLLNKGCS